jgi:hypothetical protein
MGGGKGCVPKVTLLMLIITIVHSFQGWRLQDDVSHPPCLQPRLVASAPAPATATDGALCFAALHAFTRADPSAEGLYDKFP